jgi:hypothetical protein
MDLQLDNPHCSMRGMAESQDVCIFAAPRSVSMHATGTRLRRDDGPLHVALVVAALHLGERATTECTRENAFISIPLLNQLRSTVL